MPILGTLPRPLLVSTAGAIGGKVLKGLSKKLRGKKTWKVWKRKTEMASVCLETTSCCEDSQIQNCMQLLNGWMFFAKYERIHRHVLAPTCLRINGTHVRKIGPRRQRKRRINSRSRQRRREWSGAELGLSTYIYLGRRAAGSNLDKAIINDVIDYLPTAYKKTKIK